MNVADIARLYTYNEWANERLLGVIDGLTDAQRAQPILSSFPSILETVTHIAFAEWLWLQRFLGENPTTAPEGTSYREVVERLRSVAARRREYLDGVRDHAMDAPLAYRGLNGDPFSVPLGDLLLHCANHSTYHRGQLVTMLRQLGEKPPSTDYVLFVRTAL